MALIGELATPYPAQVLPHTRVSEAAKRMVDLDIGDVVVTDEETRVVRGMLTDRDIVLRVVARDLDPATTLVGDVCTSDVKTVTATEAVSVVVDLMLRDAARRMPIVTDEGALVGMVSIFDLAMSGHVSDQRLRDLVRTVGQAQRVRRHRRCPAGFRRAARWVVRTRREESTDDADNDAVHRRDRGVVG